MKKNIDIILIIILALAFSAMSACKTTDNNTAWEQIGNIEPVWTPATSPIPSDGEGTVEVTATPEIIITEEDDGNEPEEMKPEEMKITVSVDGREETLSFEVSRENGLLYPAYTGVGRGCSTLVRIGQTNSFIIEWDESFTTLYILDFDTGSLKSFLNETLDTYTMQDIIKLYGYIDWARNPRLSPDGKLVLFETDRYGYRNDIYCHNLETGEETLVAADFNMGNKPVIWKESDGNSFYPMFEENPPPEETYIPFIDEDSECELMYDNKKFIVNGTYTAEELNTFFGEPVSDEIKTEV